LEAAQQRDTLLVAIIGNMLGDKDTETRERAVRFLGRVKLVQTTNLLWRALCDAVPRVRSEALSALAKFPNAIAVQAAIVACRDFDLKIRRTGMDHLARFLEISQRLTESQAVEILSGMQAKLGDPSVGLRAAALLSLSLRNRDRRVRHAALSFIAHCTFPRDCFFERLLRSLFLDEVARFLGRVGSVSVAAEAMAVIPSPEKVEWLKDVVRKRWSRRQLGAAIALGRMSEASTAESIADLAHRVSRPFGRLGELILQLGWKLGVTPGQRFFGCITALALISQNDAAAVRETSAYKNNPRVRSAVDEEVLRLEKLLSNTNGQMATKTIAGGE
jgi:hypothetical protein